MKTDWRDGARTRAVELTALGPGRWRARVDEAEFDVAADTLEDGRMRLTTDAGEMIAEVTAAGSRRFVRLGSFDFVLDREASGRKSLRVAAGGSLEAPMPGVVTRVLVQPGDAVTKGQPLVALEAMKMEHLIRAPRDGKVKHIGAKAGEMVQGGAVLAELEPEAPAS
jgi:biotin carboxyl carrier protein